MTRQERQGTRAARRRAVPGERPRRADRRGPRGRRAYRHVRRHRHRRHQRLRRPGRAGRLPRRAPQRPYGGWFDEVADAPRRAGSIADVGRPPRRDHLPRPPREPARGRPASCATTRALRFEFCSGVSGVHYPDDTGRELHAVYHLLSMTHNRRIRVEVTVPDADPHIPSLVAVYPTNDWHERETYDIFGIVFDGHPALTRILMPDDWPGHPQRKDYPLGGIPVEYKGGTIPPPDQRRSLQLMSTTEDIYAGSTETTEGKVFTVTGQDWDAIVVRPRRGGRGAGRRQHGPAAPVDPRRAPADPRARGRDGDRGPLRHRLPAHRHREEHGVPLLGAGRHVLHPDGLPRAVLQRGDLRARRRAAARHRGRDPREGPGHAGAPDGAQPDLLPPGLHRHRRHGDRRADRDDDRLPRARAGARPVRADHRPADEPRVHPARRRRPGPAARRARRDPRLRRADEEAAARVRRPLQRQPDLQGPARGRRPPRPRRLPGARPHRPGAALHRLPVGPAQDPALLRLRGLRLRRPDLGHLRLLRPVPDPARRDVGVAAGSSSRPPTGWPSSRARR